MELYEEVLVEGGSNTPRSACAALSHVRVVPFSISVCCRQIALQNKGSTGQERAGVRGKTLWTCDYPEKPDFHCCLFPYRNHTSFLHSCRALIQSNSDSPLGL